jgi:hypothetical protein
MFTLDQSATKHNNPYCISKNIDDMFEFQVAFLVRSPLVSPCSPIIQPCTLSGATPNFSEMRNRNREVSRLVPEPMTLFCGKPLSFHVMYVRTSTRHNESGQKQGVYIVLHKIFIECFTWITDD